MHDDALERLSHVNEAGEAHMVDVTDKQVSVREARASARVTMRRETVDLIHSAGAAKGDVLAVARIAGIMAAKRTSELIPLCHGLPLSAVDIVFDINLEQSCVTIESYCRTEAKTGVEMEALTSVSVAALTIYDMCKAVDRGMTITEIRLLYKSGGRSGTYRLEASS